MSSSFQPAQQVERTIYAAHPAMFRNNPIGFCLCILLIPVYGLGLILLFFWWLDTLGTTLTVTECRSILRKGVLSKFTTEVFHEDIRNIQPKQSFFQRIFNVGHIGISSAGQAGIEIEVDGIPAPNEVKEMLYNARHRPSSPVHPSTASAPSRTSAPVAAPSPRRTALKGETTLAKPILLDDEVEEKESALVLMAKDYAQRCLDFSAYAASFSWVSRMPDWRNPSYGGCWYFYPLSFC